MFLSVWGHGRFIILVFADCILMLPMFSVVPEIIQASSKMACL